MARKPKQPKEIASLKHGEAKRTNIPTAEYQSVMRKADQTPTSVRYTRNTDLDPQLVWRGKDEQDWSDLVVNAPPLYIQEKVNPKTLIDDLKRQSQHNDTQAPGGMDDLFGDFNGLPDDADKTDFYHYEGNWQNRMILGDGLKVMASLAEREGLRGKVQCIYLDPPYGIKFNSNFQWSTTSRDVKDGKADHITREPEQVKAFRDTWRDGIHSYLTYLRDRLTVARDLLTESGSIFVQIGDENVHRVRAVMDEVFGDENFVSQISYVTTGGLASGTLSRAGDYLLWYAKKRENIKVRRIVQPKASPDDDVKSKYDQFERIDGQRISLTGARESLHDDALDGGKIFRVDNIISQGNSESTIRAFTYAGRKFDCGVSSHWKTNPESGMPRLARADRIAVSSRGKLGYVRYFEDFAIVQLTNIWTDIGGTVQSRSDPKVYVVQSGTSLIQRCILMSTDPGDLVLDPTCGSGTTAYVAEQWGRRWITIDTSRVALALARARIMGARYPYYLLADSKDGQVKEAEVTRSVPSIAPTYGNVAHGFVYQRVPHITLKSIANNTEIDVIWERFEEQLAPLREQLTAAQPNGWLAAYRAEQKYTAEVPDAIAEWEVPREASENWSEAARNLVADFWKLRIARQQEIDASIAAKANFEYLYDKPYEDKKKVRVAGPFTVESLSPHRVLGMDENDNLIDPSQTAGIGDEASPYGGQGIERDFTRMILDNLKTAGVQQAHKEGKIDFTSIAPWPGDLICAEGSYQEGSTSKRAAIFIGPEFGTVSRPDLVAAAREAGDADFDVLITCAFNYEAHTTEFEKLGRIPVLKARMNADLHMADDLKNTGKGNLFVIFGEPDIDILNADNNQIQVRVNGVDIFKPQTGEVVSNGADGIACWFIDTDYNEESFFVRQAYFLGANDPYKSLKKTLKAEIDQDAWDSLHSDTSRPFVKPTNGRIAVKVINHLGDEVMKVFRVTGEEQ